MWQDDLSRLSVLMQIFMQERHSSRRCEVHSPLLQFTKIQLHLEIVKMLLLNHQCRANQNHCLWSQCRNHRWTLPKFVSTRRLFKVSRFRHMLGVFAAQKINEMGVDQLVSDPSTYLKKRTQRQDDSVLLRHRDDVVGTGPEEHPMKTSLYLTDVVVLRNEGETVNILGLGITKTSRGFEVKNSTRACRILDESLQVGKLETDCKSRHKLHGFQLSHSRRKTIHCTMETRHAIRHSTTIIQTSPPSHNRKQTRSETIASVSQRYTQHLSSSRTTQSGSKRND